METVSGFLNVHKTAGCTSHDVVALLRKALKIKKIGHSGTLDPFATGVLIIGINNATRLFEYLPSDKAYTAKVRFGIETDTDDITGKVLNETNIFPSESEMKEKLKDFLGQIKQKPPVYSAVKIQGQRAYKLARKDEISIDDIKEKIITVKLIEFVSLIKNELELKIECSSGTYIRAIARDLGKSLNTFAVLSSLTRTQVGNYFTLEKSIDLNLINESSLLNYLIAPSEVISLNKLHLDHKQISDICTGKSVKMAFTANIPNSDMLQLLDNNNKIVAIGSMTEDCIIKPIKVFN